MAPNGDSQRDLGAKGDGVRWSADSKHIAYVARGSKHESKGVRLIDADGRGDRLIAPAPATDPVWSPSGDTLAFVRKSSLVVLHTGRQRVVAHGLICCISWSPDGRQLAYTNGDQIETVRRDGSHRRGLGPGSAPAWSPNGRMLAYLRDGSEEVVARDVGTGVVHSLGPPDRFRSPYAGEQLSFAWAADSRAIVYSEGEQTAGVWLLRLSGGPRVLAGSLPQPQDVSWSVTPLNLRYRQPEPVGPIATSDELKSRTEVDSLATDGDRVALRMCGTSLAMWTPKSRSVVPIYDNSSILCLFRQQSPLSVALAGDRIGWFVQTGYGYTNTHIVVRSLSTAKDTTIANSGASTGPERASIAFVLGGGDLLAFSSRKLCEDFPPVPTGPTCAALQVSQRTVLSQTIWRIRDPSWQGSCPDSIDPKRPAFSPGPCQELATEPGPFVPSDLDGGRIAAIGDNAVVVLDGEGQRMFDVKVHALAAFLSGLSLVVLVRGSLQVYDMATGAETAVRPLPDVTSGGVCRDYYPCDTAKLHVEDVADGLATYVFDRKVHVLRLSDGVDKVIAAGTHAVFGNSGLFYSYVAPYPWHGRIRFVPLADLPLR